jgi:hypothetical protein
MIQCIATRQKVCGRYARYIGHSDSDDIANLISPAGCSRCPTLPELLTIYQGRRSNQPALVARKKDRSEGEGNVWDCYVNPTDPVGHPDAASYEERDRYETSQNYFHVRWTIHGVCLLVAQFSVGGRVLIRHLRL